MIAKIENGGLKLVDLGSKIKSLYVSWIKRLIKGQCHPLVNNLVLQYFGFQDVDTLFKIKLDVTKVKNLPEFYKTIFEALLQLKASEVDTKFSVRHEVLWCNKNITINCKSLNWTKWKKCGINVY